MTVDRRNILLWSPNQVGKYSPVFNPKQCDYNKNEEIHIIQNYEQPNFPWEIYNFKFYWKLKNNLEEKKLRTYDCFYEGTGMFMHRGFFIHDWLLECWSDLIDKDIKIIPATCSTLNGIVKEFHLVYILNQVNGLDETLSLRLKNDYGICDKLVPKSTNEFMEDHHLALDEKKKYLIYITPDLRNKILKKRKHLKTAKISTFKEYWDDLDACYYGEY